ncbi:succinyldiaminopimelate transaminase [Helicobacter saguini]|uniref:Succinyldiaminopimelate transaminase n=1 Tax=Helicobacter saguini TaxID=1548018 RepID=A0A347VTH2_9HELI|nr:succinyldiaminopimelate transaminase [Helicobacter saguini]MWV62099.1 succinyldiaminopimelate transaminase [Helicobacter saguini]MWV67229.1 succinyldiaminopimelate transaminase [Helicobacter saguini]MWV69582.1 succinyldiaminopimelate transaminase [Helicobacter saguini]MWV70868.1 succinyldiaminopimelate transaminase [Helicobacter saguini]TLD94298.1 succinyldiaminopimelate transaminase [Helicobacter saguini]
MKFMPYPFERLRALLKDSTPKKEGLNLSIGEPGFKAPKSVIDSIKENAELTRFYPTLQEDLIESQIAFVKQRFKLDLSPANIIPTFGSREVLFNFPQFIFLENKKTSPLMAFPNPFYQIYEGAQIANNAQAIYMPLTEYNDYKPYLSDEDAKNVDMVILNSPNNPTGQALSVDELAEWVKMALKFDFILINDECYSEVWTKSAPASILQASIKVGNKDFKNVFAINSISKRLSAPGLRSGFIAGDSKILSSYKVFRTYLGISMPLTLQRAAASGWGDSKYAEIIRQKFAKNLEIASEIFTNCNIFPYTFYLWLKVQDCNEIHLNENQLFNDELFCKELFEKSGHIALPGSYLGRNDGGIGYVRIALSKEPEIMRPALEEIKDFYDGFIKNHKCVNK